MSFRNRTAERRERETLVCDKCDKAIISAFCRDLHLTIFFSGLLLKDLFKGGWRLANVFLNPNIVKLVTQGLPSCFSETRTATATGNSKAMVRTGHEKSLKKHHVLEWSLKFEKLWDILEKSTEVLECF